MSAEPPQQQEERDNDAPLTLDEVRKSIGLGYTRENWSVGHIGPAERAILRESAMAGPTAANPDWSFDAYNYAWAAYIKAVSSYRLEPVEAGLSDVTALRNMFLAENDEFNANELLAWRAILIRERAAIRAVPEERRVPQNINSLPRRERYMAFGRFYGYPICCTEYFAVYAGSKLNEEFRACQLAMHEFDTTHVPCPQCVKEMRAGRAAYNDDGVAIGSVARYLPRERHKRARKA